MSDLNQGWAYETKDGQRDIRTAQDTKQGAMVNTLLMYGNMVTMAEATSNDIEAAYNRFQHEKGGRLIPVTLTIRLGLGL